MISGRPHQTQGRAVKNESNNKQFTMCVQLLQLHLEVTLLVAINQW